MIEMFKHNVKYKDFNGNERDEDLYFHLSLPEVTRLETEIGMTLEEHIRELTNNQSTRELLAFLERIMLSSYGQKTSDGKTFKKTKEARDAFEYSQAYANLFEEIITQPGLAQKFGENVSETGQDKKNQIKPEVVQLVKDEPESEQE